MIRCLRCNRPLKTVESQKLGLGPGCAKFGIPTGPTYDKFTLGLFGPKDPERPYDAEGRVERELACWGMA